MTSKLTRRRFVGSAAAAGGLSLAPSFGLRAVRAQDSVELEFWTISLSGPFTDWVEQIISDFESANEGVRVQWVDVPGSSATEKYLASVAANRTPDVANMYELPRFIEMGAVLDVTPHVPAEAKADFFEAFWDALTFDDKVYGIPWYASSATFLYSKRLYREAGLDPESPATTWAESLEHSRVIHDETGKYGHAASLAVGSFLTDQLQLEGIQLLSEDLTTATLNTPEAAQVIQRWVDAYANETIPPEAATAAGDDTVNWFLSGRCAMFPGGAWILNRTTPEVIADLEFAVAPGLVGAPGKYAVGFQFMTVAAETEHPEEAVKFALHAAAGQYQLELAKRVAVLPSNRSGMDDSFWTQEPQDLPQQATLQSAQQLDNSIVTYTSAPPVIEWSRMVDAISQKTGDLLNGELAPDALLAEVETEWNAILQES